MRFPRRNKIAKSCDLDKNIKYRKVLSFKPICYWYSLGKEWYNYWYKKEKMKPVTNEVVCEIKIKRNMFTTLDKKEKGKILVIDSLKDVIRIFDIFGEVYYRSSDNYDWKYIKNKKIPLISSTDYLIGLLDFNKISETFGGIEFRNYKKIKKEILLEIEKSNLRMEYFSWYDTLDVSSGCVWDLSLIDVEKKGKLKDFL